MSLITSTTSIQFKEIIFSSKTLQNHVQVFKAIIHSSVQVAVKLYLNSDYQSHKTEVDYLRSLSSSQPFFPVYYGHFEESQNLYIVMEYCESTLSDFISNNKLNPQIQESSIHYIVDSLIFAFAYLEKQKIFHRDIKPENILIDSNLKIKIIDFSISESVNELAGKSENRDYSTLGTAAYMSPELKRFNSEGLKNASFNLSLSDVYSLGIVALMVLEMKNDENYGKNFSEEILKVRLERVRDLFYRDLVGNMLKQEPRKRRTFIETWNLIGFRDFNLPAGPITSSFLILNRNIIKKFEFYEEQKCTSLMQHDTSCFQFSGNYVKNGKYLAFALNELINNCNGVARFISSYEEDGSVFVFTNRFDYSLEKCIDGWRVSGFKFEKVQVLICFRKIVDTLKNCLKFGFNHNDLSTRILFYDTDDSFKISGFNFTWDKRYEYNQEFINYCYLNAYTPPEVIQDLCASRVICEYDSEKADVFALGVILYQLVSLKSDKEVLFNKDEASIAQNISLLDSDIQELLTKMLVHDPQQRISLRNLYKSIRRILKKP